MLKFRLARFMGQTVARGLRFFRSSGTALPGLVALLIDPQFVAHASQGLRSVVVTGTNGKTTTAHQLSLFIRSEYGKCLHNQAGSNLLRGIASVLLTRKGEKWAVFEVDEAVVGVVTQSLKPEAVVFLNLFRDQMDRFGEIDKTAKRWRSAVTKLPAGCITVINADDPALAWLVRGRKNVVTFGIDDKRVAMKKLTHSADSVLSPATGQPLDYQAIYYSHLGNYSDPKSDFGRPKLNYAARSVDVKGLDGVSFAIEGGGHQYMVHSALPALYNVYNLTAAVATALSLDVSYDTVRRASQRFRPVFGRFERVTLKSGVHLVLFLIKNPVGFNQVVNVLRAIPGRKDVVMAINDRIADGQDVSWLWDVDVEMVVDQEMHVTTAGDRAADMALRLHYAGQSRDTITIESSFKRLVSELRRKHERPVYCLLTYTALVEFRSLLEEEKLVKKWQASEAGL